MPAFAQQHAEFLDDRPFSAVQQRVTRCSVALVPEPIAVNASIGLSSASRIRPHALATQQPEETLPRHKTTCCVSARLWYPPFPPSLVV